MSTVSTRSEIPPAVTVVLYAGSQFRAIVTAAQAHRLDVPTADGYATEIPCRGMVTWRGIGKQVDGVHGYTADKDAYLTRLRRIEGQVRGLQRMVDEDQYCIDILTQVSAVTRALQSVALGLMEDHLGHCVAQAIAEGGETAEAKVREASGAVARLVRS